MSHLDYFQGWNSYIIKDWPKEYPWGGEKTEVNEKSRFYWNAGFDAARSYKQTGVAPPLMPRYEETHGYRRKPWPWEINTKAITG